MNDAHCPKPIAGPARLPATYGNTEDFFVDDSHALLRFQAPNGRDASCGVEVIRRPGAAPVAICEELEGNLGMSVSQSWEAVVAAVERKFGIRACDAVWIENNARAMEYGGVVMGRWQLVTFKSPKPGEVEGAAEWRNMTDDDWHEIGLPRAVSAGDT